MRPHLEDEVRHAVFQINLLKATGLDGYYAIFFRSVGILGKYGSKFLIFRLLVKYLNLLTFPESLKRKVQI